MFAPDRVLDEKWRIAGLAISAIPFIGIFMAGRAFPVTKSRPIPGRPPGIVFGVVWTVLTLLLASAGVITTLRFDAVPLCLFMILLTLFTILSICWLYAYSKYSSGDAAQVIVVVMLIAMLLLVVAMTGHSDTDGVNMVVGMHIAPLIVWLTYATNLNLLDAQ